VTAVKDFGSYSKTKWNLSQN